MSNHGDAELNRRDFVLAGGSILLGSASAMARSPRERAGMAAAAAFTAAGAQPQHIERITTRTIQEAEKLAGITFTPSQREMMRQTIQDQLARFEQRQELGFLPNDLGPAQTFDPRLPGMTFDHLQPRFVRSDTDPGPLPENDEDIAYAPVTHLSQWIERGELTSVRLTQIYLDRLRRYDADLECVITLTDELALRQAAQADEEIGAGLYRGPLHGIPWGAKDLLDTAGIRTTWGATPYRDRVPDTDAAVVRKLYDAGAVLVAKLTLGALAYNDIWFDGRTNNPWDLEQGSSGSSAGSAAATAAGLVGFAIGTETYGSIVSPCMRCGTTGLRPTFGRVDRTGAMALCWSLDKIGPICRSVEDCMLVLNAINGRGERPDPDGLGMNGRVDASVISMPLDFDAQQPVRAMRLGYDPAWFTPEENGEGALDQHALAMIRNLGIELVPIALPELPYDSLGSILFCEAAAAFEELTRTGLDETLRWQEPRAWPNSFRQSWFIPGIEIVQAERIRRQCIEMMAGLMQEIDGIIGPSFAPPLLLLSNFTGHPSLTLRTGFKDDGSPHGITLIGRLFEEGALGAIGIALEQMLDVWRERPQL